MTKGSRGPSKAELAERVRALERENQELRRQLEDARTQAAHAEELADRDALTGLLNRRAFARELGLMLAFAQRYRSTGAVVYFDVNNLKRINDTLGHAAGDAVLTHVAEILSEHVRASDVVARLGGDEFAVLLQRADGPTARRKAKELMRAVRTQPLSFEGRWLEIVLAYGTYAFEGEESTEAAIEAADRSMYENKRSATA